MRRKKRKASPSKLTASEALNEVAMDDVKESPKQKIARLEKELADCRELSRLRNNANIASMQHANVLQRNYDVRILAALRALTQND